MSKRDDLNRAKVESVYSEEEAKAKSVVSSGDLYAEVRHLTKEADALIAQHEDLVKKAEEVLAQAKELEAYEKAAYAKMMEARKAEAEAKAKAEAEAKARAEAGTKMTTIAGVDASGYTGPVYIPGWSECGIVKIGTRFNE